MAVYIGHQVCPGHASYFHNCTYRRCYLDIGTVTTVLHHVQISIAKFHHSLILVHQIITY